MQSIIRQLLHCRPLELLFFLIQILSYPVTSYAYEIYSTINPAIYADPIKIVVWVKPGVTAEDEGRRLDELSIGLSLWEAVPTSCISFVVDRIVRNESEPTRAPFELMVIVGNGADLTFGGADFPVNGNPGTWYGFRADVEWSTLYGANIAAHEIGHAIGFHHSSVSELYDSQYHPIMHWRASNIVDAVLADDVAAVSLAYPCANAPLSAVTGTIRGRLVLQGTNMPVSGINVVAVETATGRPAIGRLTGQLDQKPGEFVLHGVPPGIYHLEFRDGRTYKGLRTKIEVPPDYKSSDFRAGYQADNFSYFNSESLAVDSGQYVDLENIPVDIFEMTIDEPLLDRWLPAGVDGADYETILHIQGGLRDIIGTVDGLPYGLLGRIYGESYYTPTENATAGNHYFQIFGVPLAPEITTVRITLIDRAQQMKTLSYFLSVGIDDDNDHIPNSIELQYGLDPLDADDAGSDADGDGLSNLDEIIIKTNLHDADSDNDGVSDGDEVTKGRNPLVNEPAIIQVITVSED